MRHVWDVYKAPVWAVYKAPLKMGTNSVSLILSLLMPKKQIKFKVWGLVETQLLKRKHLLDQKNSSCKKTTLNTTFGLLWKLAKMSNFIFFISSSEGSEQLTQTDWFSLTFFCKREHLLGIHWQPVKLSRLEAYEGDLQVDFLKKNKVVNFVILGPK